MSTKFLVCRNSPIPCHRDFRRQSIVLALRQLSESVTIWLDDAGISYVDEIRTDVICMASREHAEWIVMVRIITIEDDDDALAFRLRWPECELG